MRVLFSSRADAAHRLADALLPLRGLRPLVLAIPRGAVGMGRILADALDGDLDVVLVRKIGAPGHAEYAVGAIDESGWTWVAPHAARLGADDRWIENERTTQLATIRRRRAQYTPARAPLDPAGRVVVIVDDGLATGATMIAALHATRARHPARLICAVPVAARESLELVRPLADDVVCLHAPLDFGSVGEFYADFHQVEDDEVIALLRDAPTGDPRL